MKLLAIDPGGKHVGMAWFEDQECVAVREETPAGAIDETRRQLLTGTDVLVIEEFRLYPWLAQQQSYSDFPTVQLIGALKLLWATNGGRDWDGERPVCTLAMQPATIKAPTRNVLRGRKIKSVAKREKAGGHCADAELHGHFYVLRGAKKAGKN